MTKTKLHELADLGQSVWLDYIHRSLIHSGGLHAYVGKGLRGVTSNPSIFEKAIAESDVYDDQIHELALNGMSTQEICEEVMIEDSRMSADVLRPVYDETEGADGYFSLEVNPHFAHDGEGSITAALRLARAIDRPNVMIKIPATTEGLPAIQALTAEGHNVNITLLFSINQYEQVTEAFLSGLEQRVAMFHELNPVMSIVSFFVSRVDTKVDAMLDKINMPGASALKGKIAIANAKLAYLRFKETFRGDRWNHLVKKGAHLQRVLCGSTGAKNPKYSDVLYADSLVGPNTVNTMPPETIEAFLDHGKVALTLEKDLDESRAQLTRLEKLGINLNEVTRQLLDEGVKKFEQSYDALVETISEKQAKLVTAG